MPTKVQKLIPKDKILTYRKPIPKDEYVSKRMRGNKARDTKPEKQLRELLRERKIWGYRLCYNVIEGKPDAAFPRKRIAVFVHGCLWHLCTYCKPKIPTSNSEFWWENY